jgi:hypothetical protein
LPDRQSIQDGPGHRRAFWAQIAVDDAGTVEGGMGRQRKVRVLVVVVLAVGRGGAERISMRIAANARRSAAVAPP